MHYLSLFREGLNYYHTDLITCLTRILLFRYYKTVNEVDYGLIAIVSMGALYLVGILIKTLYYTCCHPTKLQKQG